MINIRILTLAKPLINMWSSLGKTTLKTIAVKPRFKTTPKLRPLHY